MGTKTYFLNFFIVCILVQCVLTDANDDNPAWRWSCINGRCIKKEFDPTSKEPYLNAESCKMFCGTFGLLWPQPTAGVDLGSHLSKINLEKINIINEESGKSDELITAAGERFKKLLLKIIPEGVTPKMRGKSLMVYLVNKNPDVKEMSLDVDETYQLRIGATSDDQVNATIIGRTFFGIRHGLETLSQLVIYDDIRDLVLITRDVSVDDGPVYPYRGILLDTARNYFTVESIKRTIEAMAAVKLNTFHWHITDSQSFPFVSQRRPSLTKYGAYSPSKVYTREAIADIVQFALVRGVRVLPEFDAPAHVGEGWQNTDLTVCFKAEPWSSYCVEPPCGQLNPTKDELYDVLEDIYRDMADVFPTDMFHMGGDEVSEACWNSSAEVRQFMTGRGWGLDKTSYLKLWDYFQERAQARAYKAFGKKLPLILWTSSLTEFDHIDKYLNKDDYIIQVWTTGSSPEIKGMLNKGYKLIISNYDALYLDCGFSSWVGLGNNWCSPYIGWQKIYLNSPASMAIGHEKQILGAEAALWSEQADTSVLDGRLWPRAAAMAERLWAEPGDGFEQVEQRMLHIRDRLVSLGVQADSIEPEWCYQNEGYCHRAISAPDGYLTQELWRFSEGGASSLQSFENLTPPYIMHAIMLGCLWWSVNLISKGCFPLKGC
ncbi:chitooligosaccharidolytic beta-N-acetylglucosaminidase isoform X2 [Plutella xylostella]|uniref:chitooligosaccharidolytic beta-N-acetylglucosaminidase isoform X2 n=1 Tax=Plutella xylostella TaxID=51655 RepID=UPI0020324B6E|nr:chitooligosaccharidolytic beta-N-acetylglucosaminidase isoform X2 [Plutella xylostella]